jgi:hypothetical protein
MAMTEAQLQQGLADGTVTPEQFKQGMMANAALAAQSQTPAAMTAMNSETGGPTTNAAPLAPVSPSFMSPVVNPSPQLQVAAAKARGEPTPADAAAAPVDPKSLIVQTPAAAGTGATPGATSMQPKSIDYAVQPAHAAGLTPAERAYMGAKDKLTEAGVNADQAAIDEQEKRKAESETNTKYLLDQQALATAQFAKEQEEEKQKRARLVEDARTNDGRIQKQIAEQEAQGIDPSKYYTDQSVGQKILGAFAVGIGALGAGPLGPRGERGQNVALNMMQQAANQEIDAQKANFQRSLALLGKRMDLNHEGFNQQEAMLKAEQDSVQSTYNVAIRQIESQVARYKDNDHVQEVTANLVKGLRDDMMAKLSQGIDSHLAIARKAATPVGGGLMVKLPNGQVGTMDQYQALQHEGIINATAPGELKTQADTLKSIADAEKAGNEAKNGKPMSPRLIKDATNIDAATAAVQKLNALMSGGRSLPASDTSREADALAGQLRELAPSLGYGKDTIPEHPLAVWQLNQGGHQAAMATILQQLRNKRAEMTELSRGGTGGEVNDNPAGLE